MKTNTLSPAIVTKVISFNSLSPLKMISCLFIALLFLSSCKDDDETTSPDVAKLSGTYNVSETNKYDDVDTYTITIKKSKDGAANVEISNFGGFMYVPVKGAIQGNSFTIPSQTFTANSTIKISGSGTLIGNELQFEYFMESGGEVYPFICEAMKQ